MKKVKSVTVFYSALMSGCDFYEVEGRRRVDEIKNWQAKLLNVVEMRELVKGGRLALGRKHKRKQKRENEE
jgi:hypothetical protein